MAVAYSDMERVFAAGDSGALSSAYSMWGALVYTVARRGSDSAEAASDITRHTFLSVWCGGGASTGLDLKSRLVLTARTLVHRHLSGRGATTEEHRAADEVIDRVVVRDELTALAEPVRSATLAALAAGANADAAGRGGQLSPEETALAVTVGLQQLSRGLAGSRSV